MSHATVHNLLSRDSLDMPLRLGYLMQMKLFHLLTGFGYSSWSILPQLYGHVLYFYYVSYVATTNDSRSVPPTPDRSAELVILKYTSQLESYLYQPTIT